jgi:hypothetical protein
MKALHCAAPDIPKRCVGFGDFDRLQIAHKSLHVSEVWRRHEHYTQTSTNAFASWIDRSAGFGIEESRGAAASPDSPYMHFKNSSIAAANRVRM